MTGGVVLVFALLAVVGPLVLYALVRSEHDGRDWMTRAQAERAARRDVDADESRFRRDRDRRRRDS